LIGNDLLRRFNVTLNYPARQIWLQPNREFHDPFDYSYTGLAMYFLNGRVVITDVMKNSPASKSGLQPGDVVIGINGDFSNHIQRYRDLLKATGSRVQLLIMRNGHIRKVGLTIKSLL
jgi:predicted metalloprotease with PDZ domain